MSKSPHKQVMIQYALNVQVATGSYRFNMHSMSKSPHWQVKIQYALDVQVATGR